MYRHKECHISRKSYYAFSDISLKLIISDLFGYSLYKQK